MCRVELVSYRDIGFVPPVVAGLIPHSNARAEIRSLLREQPHTGIDAFLLFLTQAIPPLSEFISEQDLSFHIRNMP